MVNSWSWLVASCVASSFVCVADAAKWAVLVAGSHGFYNYRHHADVCHAYHTLIARGIPDENIITMMYDDVANDPHNPMPGKLFNNPTSKVDIYAGCKKDYIGKDVTPANFLHILSGQHKALQGVGSGRVLNATADDDVFINFVDHGAPGLVAFPAGELYAKDLIATLSDMHQRKAYKNLVFYLEACESGSMFASLPKNMNIFAVTAANGRESSWAVYCPPNDDVVNGVHMGTCLGDEFSVSWMEDTDAEAPKTSETLDEQYSRVRKRVVKSHVLDFGDIASMSSDDIGEFLGSNPQGNQLRQEKSLNAVNSRDVALHSKFHRYMNDPSPTNKAELEQEIEHRSQVEALFEKIVRATLDDEEDIKQALSTTPPENPSEWECHRTANEAYKSMCAEDGKWTDYSLKFSATLLTLCEKLAPAANNGLHTQQIIGAMANTCGFRSLK